MGKGKLKPPKPSQGKKVRVRESTENRQEDWYGQRLRLTLRQLDFDGPFGWSKAEKSHFVDGLRRLGELEGLTWREVLIDSGKQNHRIERTKLVREAQERLEQIGLGDSEYIYSFRVTGAYRLWGVRKSADTTALALLWCDPDHKVYPMNIADN